MNNFLTYSSDLELLPNEILYLIFKCLKPIDLVTCYNTSRRLREAVTGIKSIGKDCKFKP